MQVTRAPVASSGKSYLKDIADAIDIGQPVPVMAAGAERGGARRRGSCAALLTAAADRDRNNVNGELGGISWTGHRAAVIEGRILGKSRRSGSRRAGAHVFGTAQHHRRRRPSAARGDIDTQSTTGTA